MFYDTQQRLSCNRLRHVHEVPLVHECVAPIYPLATLYHDYGHGHDGDHGRDRDGDRRNGNGHGHGDDGHDHDGDDVRHGCGHGCFCFPHLYS